jgi:lysozyme
MKNLKSFEQFTINEELSLSDFGEKFTNLVKKIRGLDRGSRIKIIRSFLLSSLLLFPISRIIDVSKNLDSELVKSEVVNTLEDILKEKGFGDATEMKLSQRGWDMIKKHEGYSNKAYKLGDGMITIGWGHAEPIDKSKYKVDQEISKEESMELLKEDLKVAADGVRRIFKEWKESGNEVLITQDMFDSLVSIAFNVGVSGLRKSDIIQKLKVGKYEECGKLIKSFKTSQKFRGLEKRRDEESTTFLSFI